MKYHGKFPDAIIFTLLSPRIYIMQVDFERHGSNMNRKELPHLKEWRSEHMRMPGRFHGSVGNGWHAVKKYINSLDTHNAKTICTGLGLKSEVCDCIHARYRASVRMQKST